MTLLIILSWLTAILIIFTVLGIGWYERRQRQLREHKKIEISELAMVFQMLRDIVAEQKLMAKDFNENVEKKVSLIRSIATETQTQLQTIQLAVQGLSKKVREIEEQIEILNSQTHLLKKMGDSGLNLQNSLNKAEVVCETLRAEIQSDRGIRTESGREENSMLIPLRGEETGEGQLQQHLIERVDTKKHEDKENSEILSTSDEDYIKLKKAYHSLIAGESAELLPLESVEVKKELKEESQRKEIDANLTPVQKLVLEYHNAGLTTSEIARELGIGKGEVRLILSLALAKKNKER